MYADTATAWASFKMEDEKALKKCWKGNAKEAEERKV
jgi:hypothetical protein